MEALISQLSRMQISEFFSRNAPVTQQQCNLEAARIAGASARPATVQGGTSYTVVAEGYAVQFRASNSALDLEFLGGVEQAYAGFTPLHENAGKLGELLIYKMNNVGGVAMYLARDQLYRDNYRLLRQTLQDYASFFASAWYNTPKWMPYPNPELLLDDYTSKLTELSRALPNRFRQTLEYLIARLPDLFADDWPMVPNHTDLLENNIHVDPSTGEACGHLVTGRITEVSPFGMSLGGLETMLGINKIREGWCYHANQQALRDVFWTTFYEALGNNTDERIEVARLAGLFLANGWEYDDEGNKVPVREGSRDLAYLDAVVLGK
ncbi:hypothetical protein NLJ89_g10631 [Agrocybe chaxingu]|uniref:Aminoglycoside phosphotransferase domain-containing protein n=1 Tax=Agrocybe chaxingu TaxID=84603 RepID=A0A9W8MQQ9_9AGAR|nr:hypothetical protein NLJ89_g10631 [Agrocybe chaxingu]